MAPRTNEQFKQIRIESRAKILVAALELFAVDGYHNTSISKIAKRAGISKGLMYNYFESKEELLKKAVLMSLDDVKEVTDHIFLDLDKLSPNQILKLSLETLFKMLVENKAMWKLTFSLAMQVSSVPSIREVVTQIFDDVFKKTEMLLKLNGVDDYIVESKLLAAQLDGIFLHYLIFEKTYNLEEVKNKLIEKYCSQGAV